jgi:hypothetical protein
VLVHNTWQPGDDGCGALRGSYCTDARACFRTPTHPPARVERGKKVAPERQARASRQSMRRRATPTLLPNCYVIRQRAAMTHALGIRCIDPRDGVRGWIPSYEILYIYVFTYSRRETKRRRCQQSRDILSVFSDKETKLCVQQIPTTRLCVEYYRKIFYYNKRIWNPFEHFTNKYIKIRQLQ